MLNSLKVYKTLKKISNDYSLNIDEYQDKYYFVIKIMELYPELTESDIYKAINFSVNNGNSPRDYLKNLSIELSKQFDI